MYLRNTAQERKTKTNLADVRVTTEWLDTVGILVTLKTIWAESRSVVAANCLVA